MANSNLTASRLRELLRYDAETGIFYRLTNNNRGHRINDVAGTLSKHRGYIGIQVDRVIYLAHRLAWLYVHGQWPTDNLDHLNGNRADNRIANLRQANQYINMQNRTKANKNNSVGMLGVSQVRGKWRAKISNNGKLLHIGYFDSPQDAHAAYLTVKRQLHPGCTI